MKRIYFLVIAAVVLYSGCDNSKNSNQNSNSNKAQETASKLRANSNAEKNDSATVVSIFNEALENGRAYNWLHYLTTQIGGR
ncbi:MAG: hypothetical protein KDC92_14495, partial [Bacteroidetes bacterium]|nr:hypothetical protein [Bacteroidota bacterium]